ncbi:hypothetical protein FACS1894191_4350 [Clostridia bacterium]|nr:hypothetical protein FACS1894191_4350 [Clostridia bacterium]
MLAKKESQENLFDSSNEDKKETMEDIILEASINIENLLPDENEEDITFHSRNYSRMTVKQMLRKLTEMIYIMPPVQREFVWKKEQIKALYNSIKSNYSLGVIIVAECEDGKQYILDGLQRTTAIAKLTQDPIYTIGKKKGTLTKSQEAEYKEICTQISRYELGVETIQDVKTKELANYFMLLNSGVMLNRTTKERANLKDNLLVIIRELSKHPFFLQDEDKGSYGITKNASFYAQAHSTTIAYCAALSVAGMEISELNAKTLVTALNENEEKVLANIEKAHDIIDRLPEAYRFISEPICKKSINATFLGTLCYAIASNPDVENSTITRIINYIWETPTLALRAYSDTTSHGAGHSAQCKERYNLISKLIKNPPKLKINEIGFKAFEKKNADTTLTTIAGDYALPYSQADNDTLQDIFVAQINGDVDAYDSIIRENGVPNTKKGK